jgi:glutaredoxin
MSKPKLFVKEGCPWCVDALAYFESKSLTFEVIDVRKDPSKMSDLLEVSGQSKTPTLQNGEFVVADFDIEEFEDAMSKNPEEAKKLGLLETA